MEDSGTDVSAEILSHLGTKMQALFDLVSDPHDLETLQELWIIIPDVGHLKERTEHIHGLLKMPGTLTFFTASSVEREKLEKLLAKDLFVVRKAPTFKFHNMVACWETMVLGGPLSDEVKVYSITRVGIFRNPTLNGSVFVELINEKVCED